MRITSTDFKSGASTISPRRQVLAHRKIRVEVRGVPAGFTGILKMMGWLEGLGAASSLRAITLLGRGRSKREWRRDDPFGGRDGGREGGQGPVESAVAQFLPQGAEVPELNEMADAESGEAGVVRRKGDAGYGPGGGVP